MNKFKSFLSVIAMMLLGSTAIMAQESKGYALFGTVPEGYEDLTSKVTIEAVGSATFVDGVFTGAGLPGRICESDHYLKMSFTEAQALTLTEDFEVHVVLAKKEAAVGNVQVAFCNNGWNAARLGYIIPNASINETATDIVLNYKDYSTANWNSYGEASFIGAPASFPAAEIFRLCAATGEQFTIKAIYVTTESAGNTEPEPEVIGYAIFGEVPTGYVDLTGNVEVSTTINGSGDAINATDYAVPASIAFTGNGLGGTYVCQQNVAVSIRFKEDQEMKLTDQMAIHVKMKRTDDKTEGALELTMCHTTWGGAGSRLSFEIPNTKVTAAEKEVLLKYANFSTKSGVSTYNQGNLLGGKTFPGGAGKELFRVCAINGEQFEITQIYIEKTYTPEPAPTIVTAEVDESATEWDKVTLNLKANCEKSTVVTYEVTYGSNTKTFTGNAGETTTYVIDGLQAETEYTFSVVAKNEDGVAATAEINATTSAKPATAEVRYYFYRTGDLPANSADLLNIDMRDGKGSTISTNQASKVAEETTFSKYLMSKSWGFVQVKAKESSLEDVTGDWYLCVRYKSTHPGDIYVNVAASDKNMLLLAEKENNDNLWKTKKVKLSDFLNTSYIFPVAANSDLFQFDTDNNNASESGYLTVDYAYLTNNENSEDLGYQDGTAPVMTVTQTDLTATSVSFNIAGIDDSDSKIYYTISDGTNNYEFTYNSKEAFDYQLTGLEKGTDYTITITAKDPFGNQSTWSQAITTVGDATAPEMVSVNKGEVLDNSIELLLKANDNQEGTLTYTISVGGNTYTTTGLAGEEVSYKVTGLTPETEYEFSVVATDAGENTSAPIIVKYSTTAFVAYRYYIVGEGDASNPNHIAVACKTEYSNAASQDGRISDYYSFKANNSWTAVVFKPTEDVPNTINTVDADNWHIVMRMRSSMDNNVFGYNQFRVNLVNNGQNFYLNTSDWFGVTSLGDGQWHTVKFKLSAAAGTVPPQFLQKGQIAVQLHVNGNLQKDEFFDIDYLYFTNEVVEDNGTQDGYKILLRDTKDNTALLNTYNAQTVDVDLNRSFIADGAWYTLCLPFSMTADQVNAAFGACKLAKLNGSELRGSSLIHLNFDYVNTIEAGVPYLFMPMADVNPVIIEDVVIDNTLRPIETTYFNMNGIFYPTHVATGDYFLGTDNYLYPVQETDNSSMKGLRAYFTIGTGAPASAQARVVMAPTVTTDLQENTITTTTEKVIKDGTIYILRGDKIYTTTGQLVK